MAVQQTFPITRESICFILIWVQTISGLHRSNYTRIQNQIHPTQVVWSHKKFDDDVFPSFTKGATYTKRILKAKMVAMASGYMMKLVESLFLLSFNFCLNKAENRAYRQNLRAPAQLTAQESYKDWVEEHVAEMMTKTCPVATAMAPSTPEKSSRIKRSKIIDFQLYDINLLAYFYCTLYN